MFRLTTTPIERQALIDELENHKAGALVSFEGWVRDHNEGKKVRSLEYQVYEALALKEGEKILAEAKHKFNIHTALTVHRHGHLGLGDTAVWVGAIASHRDDAFKAARFVIDQIKLRLPIWKKEHYVSQEPTWVFCKDHHTHVHFEEADYYQKQSKVVAQDKLKQARVAVIGAGGLGCPVLTALASAGVGHVDVVDFDIISISNIHRQTLFSVDVVGEKKATVAAQKLMALNPFIHVHAKDARVSAKNVERLIEGQTMVIDCSDNLETKYLLHDACMKARIPLVAASVYRFEGQLRTFVPGETGCLRCQSLTTPSDSHIGNCNDFGVLGASVAVIGSMQAHEALTYLLDGKNNTMKQTLFFDTKAMAPMKIKNVKKAECPTCAGTVELQGNDFEVEAHELPMLQAQMVDVRGKEVSALNDYLAVTSPVVVYCHRGISSKHMVEELRAKGHAQFYSLIGGAPMLEAQKRESKHSACGHKH